MSSENLQLGDTVVQRNLEYSPRISNLCSLITTAAVYRGRECGRNLLYWCRASFSPAVVVVAYRTSPVPRFIEDSYLFRRTTLPRLKRDSFVFTFQ